MIIQDIDTTRTSIVELLGRSRWRWHARKKTRLGATLVNSVFIEVLEEDDIKNAIWKMHKNFTLFLY
jgi:hypothetical protein